MFLQVSMLSGAKGIELWEFQQNSAWTVTNTSWKVEQEKVDATITFSITLKRKPMYFILSVILPVSMLALLNICVFLLPCESGEKSGYAMTVFLAFAVFLTIVSSTLPQNSETISIISIFLIIQTVSSTLITIIALGMLRVTHFPEDKPVPPWILNVIRFLKCRTCCNKANSSVTPIRDSAMSITNIEEKTDLKMEDTDSEGSTEDSKMTWKDVVNFFDLIFLIAFSIVLILSGFICFTVASSAKQK